MPSSAEHSADVPIYLDHNATTPVHERVATAMGPWLGPEWGNPSSGHAYGRRAARAMDTARAQVASLLEVDAEEVVFTSCGTESDNLAVLGAGPEAPGVGRLVISEIEHPAVALPAEHLERRGWAVERLAVDAQGRVDLDRARPALVRPADVVSVMLAQNETGVIQPVAELAELARAASDQVVIHTDAAQAVGKIRVQPRALGVDLLTLVGHKMYAPKGIAALYVRRGVSMRPLMFGGGQERGLSPGTESVPLCVGLGEACAMAAEDLHEEGRRQLTLREELWGRLREAVPGLSRTGAEAETLPGTLHVRFPGVDGSAILGSAAVVAASTGSACHTGDEGPAGVLTVMGVPQDVARGAVRLSLGRSTTQAQVEQAADALAAAWAGQR